MKLGFIQVYNEVNWIGFAIDQAMKLCDKLLIVEGSQFVAFPDIPERSDDGTLDIMADKAKEYTGCILRANTVRENNEYRKNQCVNFKWGLQFCNIGDYFLVLDADDFFTDDWIVVANRLMKRGLVDVVYVYSYDFVFSFNWIADFGEKSFRPVIIKRTQKLNFSPTHRIGNSGPCSHRDNQIVRYHYTWVKFPERILIRMRTSGMYRGMVEWFEETFLKMELEDGKIYPAPSGKRFTLHRYNGEHPSVLDNHPWHNIEDVRRLDI